MTPVATPFVIELRAQHRPHARAIAERLAQHLAQRRVGVRLDGEARYAGEPRVDVDTCEREQPAPALVVGVRAPHGEPLWLAPLALPHDAEEAASAVVAFLERWGFVATALAPQAPLTGEGRPSVA